MTKLQYLVVGQGISGTLLTWFLQKADCSFLVIDKFDSSSSSQVAAGIINPVTGRRVVRTWMIETLLPFAVDTYRLMGEYLGVNAVQPLDLVNFFTSAQMRLAFEERLAQPEEYLSLPGEQHRFTHSFNYELGYGTISPCYMVNLAALLPAWRNRLQSNNQLIEEHFDEKELNVHSGPGSKVVYKDVCADKIIFCDGIYSTISKYFKTLPFALNKGEALIVECGHVPSNFIYKKAMTLVPLRDNVFWAGSSHEWNFTDNLPSRVFLDHTTAILSQWLKQPFTIVDRLASIRPATVERRPFVGLHPHHPPVGILNGMGTKGCSLAPYFADQLVNHLTRKTPILPEADVNRFSRILHPAN